MRVRENNAKDGGEQVDYMKELTNGDEEVGASCMKTWELAMDSGDR
jgi:hypothetical protein